MAQAVEVMAFRKRLKKRGYRDIRITLQKSGLYLVEAIEPLAGFGVQIEMDLDDMACRMR